MSTPSEDMIYMRIAQGEARYLAGLAAVALLVLALAWFLDAPRLLLLILGVAFAYFAFNALLNVGAYLRRRRMAERAERSETMEGVSTEDVEPGDISRSVKLAGDVGGAIMLVHADDLRRTHGACLDRILASIDNDHERFERKFREFRLDNCRKYPKYADVISTLKISRILVFRARGADCIAFVHFRSPGSVWSTRYDGQAFEELVW